MRLELRAPMINLIHLFGIQSFWQDKCYGCSMQNRAIVFFRFNKGFIAIHRIGLAAPLRGLDLKKRSGYVRCLMVLNLLRKSWEKWNNEESMNYRHEDSVGSNQE